MLYERMVKAKKNLGLEEKLFDNMFEQANEEVVIGQDYIDECEYLDEKGEPVEDLLESCRIPDPESPNDLDCDEDICDPEDTSNEEAEKEFLGEESPKKVEFYRFKIPGFSEPTVTVQDSTEFVSTPKIEQKEESMILCEDPYKKEDTSGKTKSNVDSFLEKYAEGNDIIQVLRTDLMKILSDMQWIKESKNQHEQWALSWADAINEISVSI